MLELFPHWQLRVFFSDLNRFVFSGLGTPKSVDIPKLITHIVHVNTTKHDPKCGFEFTTSMRDNYPCYLLSSNVTFAGQVHFQTHPFDIKKTTYASQEETICSVETKANNMRRSWN